MGWVRYVIAASMFVGLYIGFALFHAADFDGKRKVEVQDGATLGLISAILEEEGVIASEFVFNMYALLTGNSENLKSGMYVFSQPQSTPEILQRLIDHDTQEVLIEVTFPEGFTREEFAQVLEGEFTDFDVEKFLEETQEGYLFPDTYTFFESADVDKVITTLNDRHQEVISDLLVKYDLPEEFTEDEWIIMASIVEKEANTDDSRRRVADILLRRLKEGMALQVDATFVYGVQKDSFTLTTDDLLDDHEYNTYTRTGLPPTAISNPGRDALESVLDPISNSAVYFLTGLDGIMYYADTYDGHLRNRKLYLDK